MQDRYPCKLCHRKYVNEYFLTLHKRRLHMEHYVTFVQQRLRFLQLLRAKRCIKTCVIRQRYLQQRAAANTIKKHFLEWNYTPGNPGYKRLSECWHADVS